MTRMNLFSFLKASLPLLFISLILEKKARGQRAWKEPPSLQVWKDFPGHGDLFQLINYFLDQKEKWMYFILHNLFY